MLRNVLRVVRMKTIPGVHERQTSTLPDFLRLLLDPGLPLSPPDQIGLLWVREDQRDRLGREVAAADQPLVSLKDVGLSSGHVLVVVTSVAWRAAGC